ncbi:MAG: chromosomal replication initiator protein DnaA [Oscillospiraceae bacterium]|nr:chromosomal replication initiator protein DnaA [Oscillospiraceae bacterium]
MDQFSELKSFLLEELGKSCPPTSITLWFEPMEILRVTGTEITLQFPDSRLPFVETNYLPLLTDTLSKIMGAPVAVCLTASGTQQNKQESVPPAEEPPAPKPEPAYMERFLPAYTFDSFIIGRSNELAQKAAAAVAEQPFTLHNPLYLYGQSGLGKTHLLYAVANQLRETHPEYRILYVTGEEFTNELTEALAQKSAVAFREKYRHLDVLLVDDIQFISGKMAIQQEFFHTFDALIQHNKQIIITSDVSPDRIDNLADRLSGRFSMGLVVDIQAPDPALRTAIFRRKALDYNFDLDFSVLTFLSEHITKNIRVIDGAIKKLRAYCLLNGCKCTVAIAERELKEFLRSREDDEDMVEKIFQYVCKKYMVSQEDLLSAKRNANIASPRHIAIFLVRKKTSFSTKQIASIFKKDHSTIINSTNVVENRIRKDPVFARDLAIVMDEMTVS